MAPTRAPPGPLNEPAKGEPRKHRPERRVRQKHGERQQAGAAETLQLDEARIPATVRITRHFTLSIQRARRFRSRASRDAPSTSRDRAGILRVSRSGRRGVRSSRDLAKCGRWPLSARHCRHFCRYDDDAPTIVVRGVHRVHIRLSRLRRDSAAGAHDSRCAAALALLLHHAFPTGSMS